MTTPLRHCRALLPILAITVAGCYAYNPYGMGGGMGGYPGPYSYPPGGGAPHGAYIAPNGFAPGGAVPSTGATVSPQTFGTQGSDWQSRAGVNAGSTSREANRIPSGQDLGQPSEQPVPQPRDAEGFNDAAPGNSYDESVGPFGATHNGTAVELQPIEAGIPTGIEPTGGIRPTDGVVLEAQRSTDTGASAESDDDPFHPPIQVTPIAKTRTLTETVASIPTGGPNPYDHDRKNHSWLRGVIDYDEQHKSWHLIFDIAPDVDDPYGGEITLLDHADLQELQPGDVVLVEGRVNKNKRDRLDKPSYEINRATALVPKE